ncbi:hypothetical protein ABZ714_30955 [Streptomyces sp. NPDC006798]|uniref:hypothetical protein n=1 Tax=Streptomyces sp. NPDC006798 TaxID=3155462 RepID=UPI0033D2189C
MRGGTASPVVALLGLVLLLVSGPAAGPGADRERPGGPSAGELRRARQTAAAWDGSAAAEAWRTGFHPLDVLVRPPDGGFRSPDDERAFHSRNFVLRGTLPDSAPRDGRVEWAGGGSLRRPVAGAEGTFRALSAGAGADRPLVVTGARAGRMAVATSRGPATVPAWLFTLKGYAAPVTRAAVSPSALPPAPVAPTPEAPVRALDGLVGISADGRVLTVVAPHGACDDGPAVGVLETPGSVVLTAGVAGAERDGLCTKQLLLREVSVELARPVGGRVPLDAHTGRAVPREAVHVPAPGRG